MQKIDIICNRYQLTQKDDYIKLDDILNKIIRDYHKKGVLESINNKCNIINNEKYVTQDIFKEICKNNKWYKTAEINYIFNTDINFDIIEFEKNLIHIIIKDNIKYYRLCDISNILNYKSSSPSDRLNKNEKYKLKDLLDTTVCTLFGNDSNTNFITEIGLKTLLLNSRKNYDIIEKLAEKLKININLHNDKVVSKETYYNTQIKMALPDDININYQYCVDSYFVDMYLPDYNLVIECDEFGHSKYNKNKDKEREEYIKNKLKCDFIRFNPDNENFNILIIIKQIYEKIIMKGKLNNFLSIKETNKANDNVNDKKIKIKSQKTVISIKEKEIKISDEKTKNIKIPENTNKTKKLNKCLDCDNDIYHGNQRCTYCMNKKKFEDNCKEKNRPTKEQLLKDIQELGYTGSGKKYGVSDNCIRKWIKGYDKFNL